MFVKSWNEESENIFRKISIFGRARTYNSNIALDFSRRTIINELSNQGFFSITSNKRKHENWFNIPEDVFVVPKHTKKGFGYEFKRLKY